MSSKMLPMEAAIGLLIGVVAAVGSAWLHLVVAPGENGFASLLNQSLFWPLATAPLWLGGFGWVVGDRRREKDASFEAYRRLVEDEFADIVEREWVTRNLVQAAFDAVVMASPDGQVLAANAVAQRIFGLTRDQLMERTVSDLLPDHDRLDDDGGVEHRTAGGDILGREWQTRATYGDGSAFPVDLRRISLTDPQVSVFVMREASTRVRTEAILVRDAVDAQKDRQVLEQRRRGTQLLDVGGEIRGRLEDVVQSAEKVGDAAVVDAALAALEALERLWNLSMWERATSSPTWVPASVRAVVQDAVDAVGHTARRYGTRISIDVGEGADDVVTDMARLSCALRNMVAIACREAPGSDVRVSVQRDPGRDTDWIAVFVQYEGSAVSSEMRDGVLHAFSESAESPGPMPHRMSGLALAQRLARGLGGHVAVDGGDKQPVTLAIRVPIQPEVAAAASELTR